MPVRVDVPHKEEDADNERIEDGLDRDEGDIVFVMDIEPVNDKDWVVQALTDSELCPEGDFKEERLVVPLLNEEGDMVIVTETDKEPEIEPV